MARPLARGVRSALALGYRAGATLAGLPNDGRVHVSYGHRRLPRPDEIEAGGIVKLQGLERLFPNTPSRFNVLYLVTSRLPDGAVALARTARKKGARVVVNQNGVAYPAWAGEEWTRINTPMTELLALADHVFYQSDFCRLCADRFLAPRVGPSEILYNCADTTRFAPAGDRPPRPLTLLLGGTQYQWYRLDLALQILARVRQHVADARLIVTGQLRWSDHRAPATQARDRARELGVLDRVEFLGPYSQAAAPDIFRRADILVHTKYNDPCPTTVIEAMATGLPVVYSNSGGVPELVGSDAGAGVDAPLDWERDHPADPAAMAEAVMTVAADRPRYAAAARQRAVDRFDLQSWLARHQSVFANLVGRA